MSPLLIAGIAFIPAAVAAFLAYRFRVRKIADMEIQMTPMRWVMLAASAALVLGLLGYDLVLDF
ncbi:hypothetical protein [Dongia sedimenti]|uniref:Uncharacterized protein n=1 Tax=Dongia sedimenti TaxID=3064282 RepID=A0ABU0YTC7_9PROT|nr:hypothetical protein [Rhodospirillaceae bacterium R-7]